MWFRRKKANPPMEDLINLIDSVLAAAGGSCTQCLIDELGNGSAEIGDAIVALNTAYLMRSIAPNGEARPDPRVREVPEAGHPDGHLQR